MLTQPLRMPKLPAFLERWIADPPPAWVVEFSEAGVFRAATANPADVHFEALPGGALVASPVENNLRDYERVKQTLHAIPLHEAGQGGTPRGGERRRRRCCCRTTASGRRFWILKISRRATKRNRWCASACARLSYDLDTAQVAFQSFPKADAGGGETGGVTVVATTCPLHVLAEYEALLRERHCHPGFVSSSALAALSLLPADDISLLAKLSGNVMTAAVSQNGVLRLMRTVELPEVSWEELLNLLQPMLAMAEDQLGTRADRIWLCGFREDAAALSRGLEKEFSIPALELASRFGAPQAHNAGALGYIQGLGEPTP